MFRNIIARNNTNGFTLIETLMSLGITILITMSIASILQIVRARDKLNVVDTNLEIGIKSISQELHTAKYITFGDSLVYQNEKAEEYEIYLDDSRVVKKPGFVIYMHDIEELIFFKEDEKVYIQVMKGQQSYTYLIGTDYYVEEQVEEDEEEIEEVIEEFLE